MGQNKKKPKKKAGFFTRVAFFVFLGFCGITIFQMTNQIRSYQKQIDDTEAQIEYYRSRIEALEDELATPIDYTYIRKIAKNRLNFSMPDDIIFFNDLSK